MTAYIELDGSGFTPVAAVEFGGAPVLVSVPGAARDRVAAAWTTVTEIATGEPVYGRTTGVGANRDTAVAETGIAQDLRLLRSHATAAGEVWPAELVRSAMLIRLNQVLCGGSGLHPVIVDALVSALALDAVPAVRSGGGLGTGDLAAMAQIALCLTGEQPWTDGQTRALWEPYRGDALAFLSSNAATLAAASLRIIEARQWLTRATEVAALTVAATGGSTEPFASAVNPHGGAAQVSAHMRELLGVRTSTVRVQDSYGTRVLPQVLGAYADAVTAADVATALLLNAALENPLISVTEATVFHNGNFHLMGLALALDHLGLALSAASQLSVSRLANLSEPTITGLRPFLSADIAGSSGVMLLEYIAADAMSEVRAAATPATTGHVVISRGTEDHASFATLAARQLADGFTAAWRVLACEAVCAARAIRQRGNAFDHNSTLGVVYGALTRGGTIADTDRPLSADVHAAERSLRQLQ